MGELTDGRSSQAASSARDEAALERERLREEMQALRLDLQAHGAPRNGADGAVLPPRPARARIDPKPLPLPPGLRAILTVATFSVAAAALHWGPSYVVCRHQKQAGMFYFGTTIKTCMDERMSNGADAPRQLASRSGPRS